MSLESSEIKDCEININLSLVNSPRQYSFSVSILHAVRQKVIHKLWGRPWSKKLIRSFGSNSVLKISYAVIVEF